MNRIRDQRDKFWLRLPITRTGGFQDKDPFPEIERGHQHEERGSLTMAHLKRPITLESLIRGERLADELTPQEAAGMLTALAGIQLALANRILTARPPEPPPRPDDSKLLKVDEVAAMLGTTRASVYTMSRRQDWRPFAVRISRRNLRFREAGLKKWLTQRANLNSWEAHR